MGIASAPDIEMTPAVALGAADRPARTACPACGKWIDPADDGRLAARFWAGALAGACAVAAITAAATLLTLAGA